MIKYVLGNFMILPLMVYFRRIGLVIVAVLVALVSGCGTDPVVSSRSPLPDLGSQKVAIYDLANYTDTSRAGMRASSIVEGVLFARGYNMDRHTLPERSAATLSQQIKDAISHGDRYLMSGAVSEWRYKTGIDGEPAVSLRLKLLDLRTHKVIWSAVGADNSWGNTSIGTIAQKLVSSMISR